MKMTEVEGVSEEAATSIRFKRLILNQFCGAVWYSSTLRLKSIKTVFKAGEGIEVGSGVGHLKNLKTQLYLLM